MSAVLFNRVTTPFTWSIPEKSSKRRGKAPCEAGNEERIQAVRLVRPMMFQSVHPGILANRLMNHYITFVGRLSRSEGIDKSNKVRESPFNNQPTL